jgi:hypothetical protein
VTLGTCDTEFAGRSTNIIDPKIPIHPDKWGVFAEDPIIDVPDYGAKSITIWALQRCAGKTGMRHEGNLSTAHRAFRAVSSAFSI